MQARVAATVVLVCLLALSAGGASRTDSRRSRIFAATPVQVLVDVNRDGPIQPGSDVTTAAGGDTRDFGFGPAIMREPKLRDTPDSTETKPNGGDTRDFGLGPAIMHAARFRDTPEGEKKNGGDTRDFGLGPAVMRSPTKGTSNQGSLNPSDNPSGDPSQDRTGANGGDTRDFGFGVAIMAELEARTMGNPVTESGWPSQKDGVNQIPQDWKSDVQIQTTTLREEKQKKKKQMQKRGGRKARGGKAREGDANVGNSTNPFLRESLPEEQNSVRVVPVTASEPERLLAINPEEFQRECPVTLCPSSVRCPIPGGTCCSDGKLCCPPGASCLNSKPSLCVWNTRTDPDTCEYEQCKFNYTCPFSGVPTCCRGGQGRACCNLGYQCVPGDPPSCQKLSDAGNTLQTAEFEQLLEANENGTISLKQPPDVMAYAPPVPSPPQPQRHSSPSRPKRKPPKAPVITKAATRRTHLPRRHHKSAATKRGTKHATPKHKAKSKAASHKGASENTEESSEVSEEGAGGGEEAAAGEESSSE